MPAVIDLIKESDVESLARCSSNLDYIEECLMLGKKKTAKELLTRTIDRLLAIGDRHGLELRLGIEGAIE